MRFACRACVHRAISTEAFFLVIEIVARKLESSENHHRKRKLNLWLVEKPFSLRLTIKRSGLIQQNIKMPLIYHIKASEMSNKSL